MLAPAILLHYGEIVKQWRANMLGTYMKAKRATTGINASDVAKVIGVSRQSVSQWEIGLTIPSTNHLADWCHALQLSDHEVVAAYELRRTITGGAP